MLWCGIYHYYVPYIFLMAEFLHKFRGREKKSFQGGFVWSYTFQVMIAKFLNPSRSMLKHAKYCWWKKSCTTWDVWNPVNNGIFTISTDAGFLPSTVCISLSTASHLSLNSPVCACWTRVINTCRRGQWTLRREADTRFAHRMVVMMANILENHPEW